MKTVILDTNFLLIPVQFKIDIFSEIPNILEDKVEFVVPDKVIEELKRLRESKGKDSIAASVALTLLKKRKIRVVKISWPVDRSLLEFDNVIVATNDKVLRRRLKAKGIRTIYLRSKKYLEVG